MTMAMTPPTKTNTLTQRPILILDFYNDLQYGSAALMQQNWVTITASTLCHASHIIRKSNVKVAIAVISSNKHKKIFDCIDKLHSIAPNLQWLAISMQYPIALSPYSNKFSGYFVDYFHLPINWVQFAHTLGHIWGMAQLLERSEQSQCQDTQSHFMTGCSRIMADLKIKLKKVALSDSLILISGETGTGKGRCAQQIHSLSTRKNGPLVTVNCAALPASLIHSELFGHEKGAYTGAEKQYIGQIERAEKGTLFLDEIGDLPLELQVNLLKFTDDYIIERLGGNHSIKVNCRIILATHIDLNNAVAEGMFREDLYHRINILRIHVPSLRQRREDIALLARDYLKHYNYTDRNLSFSNSAQQSMLQYDWPGNVRELKNRIHRAVVMAEGEKITTEELGIKTKNSFKPVADLAKQRIEIDTEVLLDAINDNNHNISAAARQLNISRTTCYRLIKKCKIKL